jgi:hypothetical protein
MFWHHCCMFADEDFLSLPPPSPLYRQFFAPAEIHELEETSLESGAGEIALLRILITRVLAASGERAFARHSARTRVRKVSPGQKPGLTLASRLAILAAFCQTAATIASLAREEFKRRDPLPPALAYFAAADDEPL